MELTTLRSSFSLCIPLRKIVVENSNILFSGKGIKFTGGIRRMDSRNSRFLDLRPRSTRAGPASQMMDTAKEEVTSKDADLIFIAGATGRVGSRTVRELLKLGFRVRAGVRSPQGQRAQALVKSFQQMKLGDGPGSSESQPVERLVFVECDLEKQDEIVPAIGNASMVICCIGASEKEVLDITGPYRIDYQATKNLIGAATLARVDHFILLTSLGTNKVGFPAALLNLFWGVLYWKRLAEEALTASGLPYTIVRPGGMERPTDSFKETHNILLANEDTRFGGLVSNLQVAELLACMAKNRRLAYCKVVEVVAETTAPLTPMEELLAKIPSKRDLPPELKHEPVLDPSVDSKSTMPDGHCETQEETQKPKLLSPYTMYGDLKPPSSPSPTPSSITGPVKGEQARSSQSTPELKQEDKQTSSGKEKLLSPYTAYEDLKPPSSPSPTPSSRIGPLKGEKAHSSQSTQELKQEHTQASAGKEKPLSPYAAYEDLKPPSSPSPTPSTTPGSSTKMQAEVIQARQEPELTTMTVDPAHAASVKDRPLSPYTAYDDLKPPTSPSPAPSSTSLNLGVKARNAYASSVLECNGAPGITTIKVNETRQKFQPLSPYPMYKDLKPPSSPMPSVPKEQLDEH